MTDGNETAQHNLSDLIQQIDPGSILTGFVCITEIVDAQGDHAVWSFVTPDAKAWQTIGLLHFGLMREQAGLTNEEPS